MAVPTPEDDDVRAPQERLKKIFASCPPGQDGAETLEEVRSLCLTARRRIHDPHCHVQLRQLERYARFFFSKQAHEQWARDTAFGGEGLRGLVLQLLNAIDLRLSHLEAQQLSMRDGAQLKTAAGRART